MEQGINGYLCGFDAAEIVNRAAELLENQDRYLNFSKGVRNSVQKEYAMSAFERNFSKHWSSLWDGDI